MNSVFTVGPNDYQYSSGINIKMVGVGMRLLPQLVFYVHRHLFIELVLFRKANLVYTMKNLHQLAGDNSELLLGIMIDDFRKQTLESLNKCAKKQRLLLEQNKVCYCLVNKIAQYGCPSTNSQ